MEFFSDLFQFGYLSNALAACVLSGITCGLVGSFVVCRRMVFLAGGITHASFGGLGIAFYLGTNPIGGALLFAVLSALGIEWAGSRGRIREDSAIGIIWSVGMAVGALFMSLRPGYTSGDLSSYLFGSIVTVTHGDLQTICGDHVRRFRDRPMVIDWGFTQRAPFYIDLVDFFTRQESLLYWEALRRQGSVLSQASFLERWQAASVYPGFIYLYPALMQYLRGDDSRLEKLINLLLAG